MELGAESSIMEATTSKGDHRQPAKEAHLFLPRSVPLWCFLVVLAVAIFSTVLTIVGISSLSSPVSAAGSENPLANLSARLRHGEVLEPRELQQLAEAGDAEAQMLLAAAFRQGTDNHSDIAQSFYWYLKAAEAGNLVAQKTVAEMYAYGYGVKQDYAQAAEWAARAAAGETQE